MNHTSRMDEENRGVDDEVEGFGSTEQKCGNTKDDERKVGMEKLKKLLTCSNCSRIFVQPVTLQCQHVFCSACAKSTPNCKLCPASKSIIEEIITEFFSTELKQQMESQEHTLERDEVKVINSGQEIFILDFDFDVSFQNSDQQTQKPEEKRSLFKQISDIVYEKRLFMGVAVCFTILIGMRTLTRS